MQDISFVRQRYTFNTPFVWDPSIKKYISNLRHFKPLYNIIYYYTGKNNNVISVGKKIFTDNDRREYLANIAFLSFYNDNLYRYKARSSKSVNRYYAECMKKLNDFLSSEEGKLLDCRNIDTIDTNNYIYKYKNINSYVYEYYH